jgi:hypothetical protein
MSQDFSWISAELFARHAGEKCTGRRFFVTQSGRLGLGPQGLMEGDRVVLLVGARAPFIVRTEDEEKEGKRERSEANGAKEIRRWRKRMRARLAEQRFGK